MQTQKEPGWMDDYLREVCHKSLEELASKWAPIHYQYMMMDDESNDFAIKTDLLCPVNFGHYGYGKYWNDASKVDEKTAWNTKIVKQRLKSASYESLVPVSYYSTAITKTHYFILYSYYHGWDHHHPNDLEGCLVILKKNGKNPALQGIITIAHYGFFPYVVKGNSQINVNTKYGVKPFVFFEIDTDGHHVIIQQSKGKHALYGLGQNIGNLEKFLRWLRSITGKSENIIVYYPGEILDLTSKENITRFKNTPHYAQFYYKLIDIHDKQDGLYPKYDDAKKKNGNKTFTKDGKFHSSQFVFNKADGPWLWHPKSIADLDDDIKEGEIWKEPASVVEKIFTVKDTFSQQYQKTMAEPEHV